MTYGDSFSDTAAAERGGKSDREEERGEVTYREYVAKAEVAEWQTQRTQKPTTPKASDTIEQDSAPSVSSMARVDAASGALPPRFAAASEPPDAELQRGILDAVRMGLADVARTLAAQLDARQLATGGKVVPLEQSKRRGR
jgi:hypothetical protein